MRWLFRTNFRSFQLLNATQFLGALNDNIFKLLVIYLLISAKGQASANTILSLAGAIFVIPFLLFSSGAGVLADRISKRSIIVFSKVLELAIMIFACVAVLLESEVGLFSALFLMATQSAIFGPSKYGIIPELVEPTMISKANGSLTSLTYLAIILGIFLASWLTDITNKNFIIIAVFCTFISVAGLIASLGIARTAPGKSKKRINPFFFYEIYQTVKVSWKIPNLLPCVFGSSFFLFIGAFTQLNMIPFAMQSLHMSEVGGGYLFSVVGIGIAIGALICGKLSKDAVEPGISCLVGFFVSGAFLLLSLFSFSFTTTIIILVILGVLGGMYVIPFDSYIQVSSPVEKRGQIIAAANFFSFVGVLMAAIYLYLISEKLGLSASSGFALLGILSFGINSFLTGRLSALFLPFFAKKVLKRFRKLLLLSSLPDVSTIIILQSNSWWDAILLYTHLPSLKILVPSRFFRQFPWINGFIHSIRIVPEELNETTMPRLSKQLIRASEKGQPICLFIHSEENGKVLASYEEAFHKLHLSTAYARISKERVAKHFLGVRFIQKEISLKL